MFNTIVVLYMEKEVKLRSITCMLAGAVGIFSFLSFQEVFLSSYSQATQRCIPLTWSIQLRKNSV